MRLRIGILILAMTASAAWAQMPILDNTRNKLKTATDKNLPQNALQQPGTTAKPGSTTAPTAGSAKAAAPAAKPAAQPKSSVKPVPVSAHKPATKSGSGSTAKAKPEAKPAVVPPAPAVEAGKKDENDGADLPASMAEVSKKFVAERRDPFLSPVVTRIENTSCTTGKRCLTPGQISLKGVVRSENGMIAVVVNSMNKAYFLRENDPIFNGYVLRITGDSITFRENFQDNLGKQRTREVVKRILTPAV